VLTNSSYALAVSSSSANFFAASSFFFFEFKLKDIFPGADAILKLGDYLDSRTIHEHNGINA